MSRIELSDTTQSMVMKMCEGNPGALRVLCDCLKQGAVIDPDAGLGEINAILAMDTLNLYGSHIWRLYKDVCDEDLQCMIAVLRAWQLGFVSEAEILHAVENYGEGINLPVLVGKVEEELPHFERHEKKKAG